MAYDVIVVGAGNAALCAALSAHEGGARVLVLEKAPEEEKGGNSYFTAGGFRFAHEGLEDVRQDILDDLSEAEAAQIDLPAHGRQHFYEQLMKVTRHQAEEDLAWTLIDGSRPTMAWLQPTSCSIGAAVSPVKAPASCSDAFWAPRAMPVPARRAAAACR